MTHLTRRQVLMAGAAAIAAGRDSPATAQTPTRPQPAPQGRAVTKGRLKQSVCRGPYSKIPLPEFCKAVADLGGQLRLANNRKPTEFQILLPKTLNEPRA